MQSASTQQHPPLHLTFVFLSVLIAFRFLFSQRHSGDMFVTFWWRYTLKQVNENRLGGGAADLQGIFLFVCFCCSHDNRSSYQDNKKLNCAVTKLLFYTETKQRRKSSLSIAAIKTSQREKRCTVAVLFLFFCCFTTWNQNGSIIRFTLHANNLEHKIFAIVKQTGNKETHRIQFFLKRSQIITLWNHRLQHSQLLVS